MLNTARTFWVIGQIAFYAFLGLLAAGIITLLALEFEVIEAVRGEESVEAIAVPIGSTGLHKTAPIIEREPAAVN